MCGIAGIVDVSGGPIDLRQLTLMTAEIGHRGPDDEGYVLIERSADGCRELVGDHSAMAGSRGRPSIHAFHHDQPFFIGLAHRRFSIVDLSTAAHQPMFDHARSCCVVFNGEIYNHYELRRELERLGARFLTTSDTEVLLEAYKLWGVDCFARFNGFWALALYDFAARKLIVSRDRLGKKPLYWMRQGSRIHFASEIKSLLAVSDVAPAPNISQVHYWLATGRSDTNAETMFEGIHRVPAAHWSVVDDRFGSVFNPYWELPYHRLRPSELSVDEAVDRLRDLLTDAVRIRLDCDVPVGVELSGGLDSTAIVSFLPEDGKRPVAAFTVDTAEEEWDELSYATTTARAVGLPHVQLPRTETGLWQNMLGFTYLHEEPYHAPSLFSNLLIWKQMRMRGAKVSLNGAGGDEVFCGYGAYYAPAQLQALRHGRFDAYFQNAFRATNGQGMRKAIEPLVFGARQAAKKYVSTRRPARLGGVRTVAVYSRPWSLDAVLRDDMTTTLMPYWLRSGDKCSMALPIEVRAPFLDHRVVELGFSMPASYLLRDGWHKWICRRAVSGRVPDEIAWRTTKMGYPFPYARFFSESRPILDVIADVAKSEMGDLSVAVRSADSVPDWRFVSCVLWYELFIRRDRSLFDRISDMVSVQAADGVDVLPTPAW
jgi:asparagine synthase (glutamine-hydrolysing)